MAIVAALRDPKIIEKPEQFCPDRTLALWNENPDKLPIFGDGARACIARHHVLECLVSAFIGLLCLPELDWANRMWGRIVYEGPVITGMRLREARRTRST
jgi:cytochrome P450